MQGLGRDDAAHKDTVDPAAWTIVDGKLYLVHNQYWLGVWREHSEEYIRLPPTPILEAVDALGK